MTERHSGPTCGSAGVVLDPVQRTRGKRDIGIRFGQIAAIVPGIPVIKLLVAVQVVNGILLPVTLFFVWRLSASKELMGEHANGPVFNVLAGLTVVATSSLSLLLLGVTFFG